MKRVFWDIESLSDLFTIAVWQPDGTPASASAGRLAPYADELGHDIDALHGKHVLDLYVLADNEAVRNRLHDERYLAAIFDAVRSSNRVLELIGADNIAMRVFDLKRPCAVAHLALEFGVGFGNGVENVQVVDRNHPRIAVTSSFDFAFDFEKAKPDHDVYLMGYNSYNYDLTMLAHYLDSVLMLADAKESLEDDPYAIQTNTMTSYITVDAISAKQMRDFNNVLFMDGFINNMASALYIDEKRYSDVGHGAYLDKENCDFEKDANRLRRFWLASGRHIDVARLNEKQVRVGLKRMTGVIGRQIFEDGDVATGSSTDFAKLLAYNASDVINLQFLFENGEYRAGFQNKSMILTEYPECVFRGGRVSRFAIRNDRLRIDSTSQQIISSVLCPNPGYRYANALDDKEHVDLRYPAPELETAENPCRDILDETANWFYGKILPRIAEDERAEAVFRFERAWQHYDYLRHVNLNNGLHYKFDNDIIHPDPEGSTIVRTDNRYHTVQAPGITTSMLYYGKDGRPTSCYITISEGGAHGAEYNKALYDADMEAWRAAVAVQERLKAIFAVPDGFEFPEGAEGDLDAVVMINTGVKVISRNYITDPATGEAVDFSDITPGRPHRLIKDVLKSGFTRKRALWKPIKRPALFRRIVPAATTVERLRDNLFPEVLDTSRIANLASPGVDMRAIAHDIETRFDISFTNDELDPRYTYTSAATTNHEDFASYYPNLLRMMRAFWNESIGRDRYGELYDQKQRFGVYQKDPTLAPAEEQEKIADLPIDEQKLYWKRRRNGVKLMINAGSGAGGAVFDNAIRMNNNIMAMRMIGQLFIWRIGQAQAIDGANIPSTNTDGLYTVMDEDVNNALLERESADIGVDIEPERMELISKDANNRVEYTATYPAITDYGAYDPDAIRILSAGGSLACYRGPSAAKSLDHPAIYDYAVAHCLIAAKERGERAGDVAAEMAKPFDRDFARAIIGRIIDMASTEDDLVHVLLMFQTMVASSPKSYSYVVACDYDPQNGAPTTDEGGVRIYRNVQQYNRAFFVKAGMPIPSTREATAPVVYLAKCVARKGATTPDEYTGVARGLLREKDITDQEMRDLERTPAIVRLSGISENQTVALVNDDLHVLVRAGIAHKLIDALDLEAYLDRIESIYEENWRNAPATELPFASVIRGTVLEAG